MDIEQDQIRPELSARKLAQSNVRCIRGAGVEDARMLPEHLQDQTGVSGVILDQQDVDSPRSVGEQRVGVRAPPAAGVLMIGQQSKAHDVPQYSTAINLNSC